MISARTVVLDTSVLAELMRPQPDMAVMRWVNGQPIGTLAVTAVSVAELTYAMLRMSELARRIDLRQALDEFVHDDLANRVLPFDDLAADYYAEFVWKREQAGDPVDVADAQIAAICRAYGVTLATKDAAPYDGLGVTTVDPWTAPPPERIEPPVLVPPLELDRHGKPIPPRRPGVARGGVGPSRPPRQRRPRRTKSAGKTAKAAKTKKPAGRGAASARTASANGNGRARTGPRTTGKRPANAPANAPDDVPTVDRPEPTDEERFGDSRRAAERLQMHVTRIQEVAAEAAAKRAAAVARRAAARAAQAARDTQSLSGGGTGPGRRGARLLGPLVDAEGRPVERKPDGRVVPRTARSTAKQNGKPTGSSGGGPSGGAGAPGGSGASAGSTPSGGSGTSTGSGPSASSGAAGGSGGAGDSGAAGGSGGARPASSAPDAPDRSDDEQ